MLQASYSSAGGSSRVRVDISDDWLPPLSILGVQFTPVGGRAISLPEGASFYRVTYNDVGTGEPEAAR